MRSISRIKAISFLTVLVAVFLLAAPGYSWTGRNHHGGYANHGYHDGGYRSHHYGRGYYGRGYYGHGYYGRGYYGHGYTRGYYRGCGRYYGGYAVSSCAPYYSPGYWGPSVSLAVPFPFVFPGVSVYVGP